MADRQRLVRIALVLSMFGLLSLFRVLSRPSFETIRPVDAVQLIGTGMCFGAALLALGLFVFGRRSTK
jgi:hypothetical protein